MMVIYGGGGGGGGEKEKKGTWYVKYLVCDFQFINTVQ